MWHFGGSLGDGPAVIGHERVARCPERRGGQGDRDQGQQEPRAVAAGPVVQGAREQRAQAGADGHQRIDGAVHGGLPGPGEHARAESGDDGAARTLADAEQQHVRDQQQFARAVRQRVQHRDAQRGADEADRRGLARAEPVGEPARGRYAGDRQHAGRAESRGGLQRREADVDEVGDRLHDDQVHAQGGEEHDLHEQPEAPLRERGAQRAARAALARPLVRGRPRRGDRPPGQPQRGEAQRDERDAQPGVGLAPAARVDQRLGQRHHHERAAAEPRIGDADRGAHAPGVPPAEQGGRRDHAHRAAAQPDEHADADVEVPEFLRLARDQVTGGQQGHPARVQHARPETLEHQAGDGRRQPRDQHQRGIDAGHLGPLPAELGLQRQQEDHVRIADPARDEIEEEAQRQHPQRARGRGGGAGATFFAMNGVYLCMNASCHGETLPEGHLKE